MRLTPFQDFNATLSIRPALIAFTTIYLVVPSLIFTWFWFRPEVSVVAVSLGIALATYHVVRSSQQPLLFQITLHGLLKLLILAAAIVYFSGIGGFSIQSYDYWGHNTKFFELANQPWPISYGEAGTFACYYYGYYLVPALLYKFFPGHLNWLVIIWSGLGIYLILIWYFLLFRRRLLAVSLFLLGGVPYLFFNAIPFYHGAIIQQHKLYFLGFAQAMLWQPHQCIPAALLAAVMIHTTSFKLRYGLVCFLACSCLVWGPFVSLGTLGIIFPAFIFEWVRGKGGCLLYKYWEKTDVLSFIYILPLVVYFMSSNNRSGLATVARSGPYWLIGYLIFLAVNLLCFFYLIMRSGKSGIRLSPLLASAFCFLCLISFFKIGLYNDLVAKASMPALFLIYFEIARLVSEQKAAQMRSRYFIVLNGLMFITIISTMDVLKKQFEHNAATAYLLGTTFPVIPYHTYANSYQMLKAKYTQTEALQYLGDTNSIYNRYLSPK
ncbi:hypothetical protein [Dyadobacter fermentans]|uniref:Glycosyltransferase RgtA/B/C/D-like domain-containing protein n=1 Tax=Dyadobacter fermentans (strain ATCC 700827 / DSM 18053 / CIP 107007 / KCTC 52180 / NS114) TaxID=471854 RepID=C6VS45_DYAFD|nr:hypothetical protein [Dyadobacter fermentans]ACT94566.1 hypothetical protein Dfer_3355 [Dyadobacter fermentans DSM 18053]